METDMRIAPLARWSIVLALVTATGAWAQAPPKAQTATQFFLAYRAAFDKATKIEDLYPYMAAKNRKQAEETPKAERDKMFGLIKIMGAVAGPKVLKEEHMPDGGALLTVEGMVSGLGTEAPKKATGKVTILKEGGAWKIGEESWNS
jgi:hypothetical protein